MRTNSGSAHEEIWTSYIIDVITLLDLVNNVTFYNLQVCLITEVMHVGKMSLCMNPINHVGDQLTF